MCGEGAGGCGEDAGGSEGARYDGGRAGWALCLSEVLEMPVMPEVTLYVLLRMSQAAEGGSIQWRC